MKRFRKVIFWVHLICGVTAGLVIAVMSFTGAALAFKSDIIAWAERSARLTAPESSTSPRLSVDELLVRFREQVPESRPSAITVFSQPELAVMLTVGRDAVYYQNRYTGGVTPAPHPGVREFFRKMEDWHRWLALSDASRETGKAVTGASNAVFLFLCLSGLYLWFPQRASATAYRAALWFMGGAKGRARDWNWHNVFGIWSVPVLAVLTLSGVVISYRWASDAVYRIAGEQPPAGQGPGAPARGPATPSGGPQGVPPVDAPSATPLSRQALFDAVIAATPSWESISLRLAAPGGQGRGGETRTRSAAPGERAGTSSVAQRGGAPNGSNPPSFTIRGEVDQPSFSTTTVTLSPTTGQILKRETFRDSTAGRRARVWLRFLHTGEAFGTAGKALAGLACMGGLILVYTGFALSYRRFFRKSAAG